jgi:hypothetical protein
MRDDDQRGTVPIGDRVTHGHALDRERCGRLGRLGIHRVLIYRRLRAWRGLGRIPEFNLQRAVAHWRRARRGIEAAQVQLVGLDHRHRADAHRARPRRGQLRRIDVQPRRSPDRASGSDGDEAQCQQGAGSSSLRCFHSVISPWERTRGVVAGTGPVGPRIVTIADALRTPRWPHGRRTDRRGAA